jgi:excisionase family DNA binding protein
VAEDNERELAQFLVEPNTPAPANTNSKSEPPEFLTAEEAATLLRVNIGTLREVIKTSAPPWAKPIGHQVRISRSALLKWFETEVAMPTKRRRAL